MAKRKWWFNKNKSSGKSKSKRKKFSFNERIDYYNSVYDAEYARSKGGKLSKRGEYAISYLQGAERGYSLNFDDLSPTRQKGQKAGVKMREKSKNTKF